MEISKPRVILVIDFTVDWSRVFKKEDNVVVEQTEWRFLDANFVDGKLVCDLEASEAAAAFTFKQSKPRQVVSPDLVFFRNFPTSLRSEHFKNSLFAMMISGIVCVNSSTCLLATIERAWLYAELCKVAKRCPSFKVVALDYYSNIKGNGRGTSQQLKRELGKTVLKVGSCNAGFGKALCEDERQRSDVWSILATQKEYVTEESFINHEYEYRVQCIGKHVRCFKRTSSTSWKNNQGNLEFASMPVEDKHYEWQKECAKMFDGGNDIFALDVLRDKDGNDTIIEINPSCNGLFYDFEEEDCNRMRLLCLSKLNSVV